MNAIPIAASRPEAHRNSAYGSSSRYTRGEQCRRLAVGQARRGVEQRDAAVRDRGHEQRVRAPPQEHRNASETQTTSPALARPGPRGRSSPARRRSRPRPGAPSRATRARADSEPGARPRTTGWRCSRAHRRGRGAGRASAGSADLARPKGRGESDRSPDGRGRAARGTIAVMSHTLYRLGRHAARHPWTTIGAWLVVAALVVAASGAFGRDLEDSFEVPGTDSQKATAMLAAAGVRPGRADRPGGRDDARSRDVVRRRVGRAPGRRRGPAERARARATRSSRPTAACRSSAPPVSGARGAERRRSARAEGVRRARRGRPRRCRSRWAATSSTPSRSPRWAWAR